MTKIIEGDMVVKDKKFALVVSRFNDVVTNNLMSGCTDTLKRHGTDEGDITIVRVPGAFEIPMTAKKVAQTKNYDAIICLGAVIRGQTPDFDFVSAEVTKGIAQVSMEADLPVTYGIITADTLEQAIERSGAKQGNKGKDAALAAIEMVNLSAKIK
ncbi:MAG TPA: 6,7-dimethyl-8-ribityllumazine synthase [Elusimicrobiales bacterium]|nr:6,7-dimethyl-8-ribityllumazine synthase [Elusimicrobiales bacterium]